MSDAAPTPPDANEYELERRKKRDALRDAGHDVYGRRTEGIGPIIDLPAPGEGDTGPAAKVAGRIVLKRDMGKLSFLTIRDHTGDVQIGLQKNRLSDDGWAVRNALDLGDLIVAEGPLGVTKTGQPTVWADTVSMASKSLVTPPDKHKGLEDQELRYRQRYVDLWANPESMEVLQKRFAIIDAMRKYLRDRGFVEVETPMLQPIHGGAAARPFETHHNAYGMPLFMRIAPELYLKRLLVGGMPKVFEINRNFRNEGVSPRHNPEFTMLEAYEAYGNWETMAELVEDMICTVAKGVVGSLKLVHHGEHGGTERVIDIEGDTSKPPGQRWRRVSMTKLVKEHTTLEFKQSAGFGSDAEPFVSSMFATQWADRFIAELQAKHQPGDPVPAPKPDESSNAFIKRMIGEAGFDEMKREAKRFVDHCRELSPAEQLVAIYEKFVEPKLIDPCFVTSVPSVVIPLARPREDDPYFADVYELAIGGQEISPGYTELNDPDVQAQLFRDQAVEDEGERQKVDYDFLHALKVGMPPAGGMGLGVDRLVMLLLGQPSIRDVLAFPLMRPQA